MKFFSIYISVETGLDSLVVCYEKAGRDGLNSVRLVSAFSGELDLVFKWHLI